MNSERVEKLIMLTSKLMKGGLKIAGGGLKIAGGGLKVAGGAGMEIADQLCKIGTDEGSSGKMVN